MDNQSSLLRKESFGGTLNNAVSAKRIHLTSEEYAEITTVGKVPDYLRAEIKAQSDKVIIREPSFLPEHNFSAPDTVFFEITRACNLTCTHCFNDSGRRLPDELSDKERLAVIEDLCFAGVQEVRFTGGEPLVIDSLFDYVALVRKNGLRASIGTNGALISALIAEKLASAGLNNAITSIDGMEEKHDSIRGKGSFRKTLTGVQALLDAGIPVRVNTVVMRSNFEEVIRVAEYFSKRSVPVMIRRLIPAGRADDMTSEMLTKEDYSQLRERLDSLLSNPKVHLRGHYLKDDKVTRRITLPFSRNACSAGHRGLVVLPDGAVQTCGFLGPLGESSPGNLKTESLSVVWRRLVGSQHIETLQSLLPGYNAGTCGPETNCLAIALANQKHFLQIQGLRSKS